MANLKDLQPRTKQILIIAASIAGTLILTSLIVAAALTGSMDALLSIVGGIVE